MTGDHVTLGEADAEVELDARYENKSAGKSGTGCVHTAPGHGADDYKTGVKYGLEIYAPLDAGGHYNDSVELFAGLKVWDANPKVSQNHLMLGHAEAWFHEWLGGIQIDLTKEPLRQIVISPTPVGEKSSIRTVNGKPCRLSRQEQICASTRYLTRRSRRRSAGM
jgi:hypothetical protein